MKKGQLPLSFMKSKDPPPEPRERPDSSKLAQWLEERLGCPFQVVYTKNRYSFLSFRLRRDIVILRIHEIFHHASHEVKEAVAGFVEGDRKTAKPVLHSFLRKHNETLQRLSRTNPPRSSTIRQRGDVFHLGKVYDDLNGRFFQERLDVKVTWGRYRQYKTKRIPKQLRLGSYNSNTKTIRVNPLLDNPMTPKYVLESILYHEMLHAELGVIKDGSRRSIHGDFFRRREMEYPHLHDAETWIRENLMRLIRSRNRS